MFPWREKGIRNVNMYYYHLLEYHLAFFRGASLAPRRAVEPRSTARMVGQISRDVVLATGVWNAAIVKDPLVRGDHIAAEAGASGATIDDGLDRGDHVATTAPVDR